MRKIATLFGAILLLIGATQLFAQNTVQIGNGTSVPANTLYGPVYRFSATSTTTASRSNMVLTQSELSSVGILPGSTITALQFNKTNSANFNTPASSYKMYMANTSNTSLATTLTWASVLSTHTEVFSSTSFNIPLAAGWVTWSVTPFVYTGGSLEIATECSMGGNGAATDAFKWEYTDGFADKLVGVASLGATLNGSVAAYKHRPNIRITYLPNAACTIPPVAGTAISSVTNVCSGTNFNLGLTGNSIGTGQTYQWQSSTTGSAPWTNIGTAITTPGLSRTQSISSFYRCVVTCSSVSDTSTIVSVSSPALISGSFTINNALPTGSGNFQTFADAINHIACGISGPVTFNVEVGSGPYTEQVTIPQIFGANSSNRVTFIGNGATIQFDPTTTDRHVIKLDGADYITLDSIDIRTIGTTTSSFGWGIHLTNGADYDSIKNCTITIGSLSTTQSNSAGIVASGSTTSVTATGSASNNVIIGNTITGGYQGVRLNGTATSLNGVKNQVIRNVIKDFYADGISLIQNDSTIIAFNDVSRPTRTVVTTFSGIELGAGNIKCIVEGNKIHDTHNAATTQTGAAYGVFSTANDATVGNENRVINNLIYNFNSGSGTIYGLYNSSSDGVRYYHNTVVLDNAASTAGITRGFYQLTAATNIDIKNNIIYINRGGTGDKHCLYFGTTTSTITSNNNVLYNISSSGTNNGIGSFGTASSSDLSAWKSVNSNAYDQQSISADPLFTDVNLQDYTPTEVSVENIGANVGVAKDINGLNRILAAPDPGAFEVPASVGVDLRVDALVSPAISTAGCYNTENIRVAIRNNSVDSIKFNTNPTTISVSVAGVVNTVYTATINTDTLAPNEVKVVNVFAPTSTINMSALGNYNFTVTISVTGDINPSNNTLIVDREKLGLTGGTITATPESYCAVGGTPKLTSTDAEGYNSVKWQQSVNGGASYTDIANSDTLIYTLLTPITQNTYFRMVAVCATNEQNSTEDSVIINNPQILTSQGATRCGPGSVTLTATANGTADVKWYENQTGGTTLFTGASFVTPSITSTKTYYAAASQGGGGSLKQLNALPLAGGNGCGAGNLFNLTPATNVDIQGFILNVGNAAGVSTPVSIWYKTGTYVGSEITQANWTLHQTLSVNSAGPNQPTTVNINPLLLTGGQVYGIYINFEADYTNVTTNTVFSNADLSIEVGAGVCTAFTSFNALRGFNGSVLYTTGCEGTRTPVTATVTSAPSITAATIDSVVCNSASASLTVTSSNNNYTYTWTPSSVALNGTSVTVTPTETTKYYVNASDAGTNCTALDSVTVRVQPVSTVQADPKNFCIVGGVATLRLNPLTGYAPNTIQWQVSNNNTSFNNINGATNPTYVTPTINTTTYFKALVKNGSGSVCSDSIVAVVVNTPTIINSTSATRCGAGTVNLSATANAGSIINWYTAPTGGTSIFTGNTFTTPSLLDTTNYYVSASEGGGIANTGKATANTTATSGAGTTNFGLVFDALTAFELKSVVVYPIGTAAGTVTIDVIDATGTVLHTKTVNVTGNPVASAVGQKVDLNFNIQPGTNLKLRPGARSTGITGLLFEPSASAPGGNYGYPFVVPGIVSINTSTLTAAPTNTARNDLYYYFYDWEVVTGCESARTMVTAFVDTSASCNALPVGLINFTGIKEGTVNRLSWTTTTEINNAGFNLERSADGRNFSSLSFISTKAENGNSSTNINYNFSDTKVLSGNNYYRLKQVDKDGKATYSSVVLIKSNKVKDVTITGLYPNPASNEINLSIESPNSERVTVIVTDLTGKVVIKSTQNLVAGSNTLQLNTAKLANGNYFVKMICTNGCETGTIKFIKH